jgi:hypothetical protein
MATGEETVAPALLFISDEVFLGTSQMALM